MGVLAGEKEGWQSASAGILVKRDLYRNAFPSGSPHPGLGTHLESPRGRRGLTPPVP